jgi:YVTN family beta-propeller protein
VTVVDAAEARVLFHVSMNQGNPQAVCYRSASSEVYCGGAGTNTVSVIDCPSNNVAAVLYTLGAPTAICDAQDKSKLYTALSNGEVLVIDVHDTVVAEVTVGQSPRALCYGSITGKLYCADSTSGTVSVVDCFGDTLVATVSVGSNPRALCFNSLNNKIYCANCADGTVTVIDGDENQVLATVAVGPGPWALCCSQQHGKVYCANRGSNSIAVIDRYADSVIATVSVGSAPSALIYDASQDRVYCARTNWVSAIDCARDSVVRHIYTGGVPMALALDAVSHTLYAADSGDNSVAIIDAVGDTLIERIGVPEAPVALAWDPSDMRAYVACWYGQSVAVIRDSMSGAIGERDKPAAFDPKPAPAVVRGVLFLPGASGHKPQAASLMDASGRKVLDLKPGANDVRALAPGVYFVREAQAQAQAEAIRKVVVTR